MKKIIGVALVLMLSPVTAEECDNADTIMNNARWAYDTENKTLRLCVEDGNLFRCTTFPKKVFMDDDSFGYTENPFRR